MWNWLPSFKKATSNPPSVNPLDGVRVLKHAQAMRVVFFYPGEEGTYVDDCMVTLFENGVVHLRAKSEETTTHLHHCEILWRYEVPLSKGQPGKDGNLRVLKFKSRDNGGADGVTKPGADLGSNPTSPNPPAQGLDGQTDSPESPLDH
jgi:hypothetical protein